ncbi:hypothetical protein P5V15_004882 [Pogonomyrmex californicus]
MNFYTKENSSSVLTAHQQRIIYFVIFYSAPVHEGKNATKQFSPVGRQAYRDKKKKKKKDTILSKVRVRGNTESVLEAPQARSQFNVYSFIRVVHISLYVRGKPEN